MEYVILGLLMLQPNSVYGIRKAFEQGISMFYSASLGSIQTAVKRLEDKGLVAGESTVENGRAKKILGVTVAGEAAFFQWLHAPLEQSNLEVGFLSRLYFVGLIPLKQDRLTRLRAMREDILLSRQQLLSAEKELDQLQLPDAYQEVFFFQRKVLQYGVDTHGYGIEWLERLIEALESELS